MTRKEEKAEISAEQEAIDVQVADDEKAAKDAALRNSAIAGSAAIALANEQRRRDAQAQRQAAASVGDDPDAVEIEKPFVGQIYGNEHYLVVTSVDVGRDVVEIRPVGGVGQGLFVAADRLEGLRSLLGKVETR